ncbi:unnamed protein product [Clonostachys rosea]|uniref:Rhodopsin domain-containing protein n=1 Tax=Bionectria ochroleuca TaxID=29856 RepID=A0ABY6V424_BIOOC|nr:unnamed protein product [Clonostachys rosea]
MVIIVIAVCMALTTCFVGVRVFAKLGYLKSARLEDYLLIPMFATYIAFCVYWLKMCGTTGHYVHMWNFRLKNLAPFFHNGYYGVNFLGATMLTIKPAILLEWIHIFAVGSRSLFAWACYVVATVNFLTYFIGIFVESFSCSPIAGYWDKTIESKCIPNVKYLSVISGVINVVLDVIIVILPQKIIWNLNITRTKKFGVSLVFLVGLISVAAATTRMALSIRYIDSSDVTYNLSQVGLWAVVEMTAGILVFVAPAAPKPVVHLAKQFGNSVERLVTLRSYRRQRTSEYASGRDTGNVSQSYEAGNDPGKPHNIVLRFMKSKSSLRKDPEDRRSGESEAEMVPPIPKEHIASV